MRWLVIFFSVLQLTFSDYLGCYKDGSPRDLLQRLHHNNVTVKSCVSGCLKLEYEYAAIQFSYLCFCGAHYGRFGKLPDEMCDSTCRGNEDQYCGGDWKNSVYSTGYKGKTRKKEKRDQIVLFDEPQEIEIKSPMKVTSKSEEYDTALPRSDITSSPQARSEDKDPFNAPHSHINPSDYNQDNIPGSPGESISAFPLATDAPPLEEPAGQTSTEQHPLEETAGQSPVTSSSPDVNQQNTPGTYPDVPSAGTDEGPGHVDNGQTGGETIASIPAIDNKNNRNDETVPSPSSEKQRFPGDGSYLGSDSPLVDGNFTNVNGTVININGTVYFVNGTLTKVNKTKAKDQELTNTVIEGMLNDVKSISRDSSEHVINDTQAGVTTDGPAGQLYSYDGTSSTTYNDQQVSEKINNVDNGLETKVHPSGKSNSQGEQVVTVNGLPAVLSNKIEQSQGSPTNKTKETAASSISSPPASLSLTPSPPAPQPDLVETPYFSQSSSSNVSPTSTPANSDERTNNHKFPSQSLGSATVTINKALAAEASGFHDSITQGKNKKKTACQVERKIAISMDDSFVPDCQEDGSYAPVQCFQHLGFGKQCWCVDDKGQEVPDTRTMDGMTPTCEKVSRNRTLPQVKHNDSNSTRTSKNASSGVKIQHIATSHHSKHPKQSKIETSRPLNLEYYNKSVQQSRCEIERKVGEGQKDTFSPDCLSDGSYSPVQCFEHAHYGKRCWCVDNNGKEVSGTSLDGGQKPDCSRILVISLSSLYDRCGQYGCCADGKTPSPDPAKAGCRKVSKRRPVRIHDRTPENFTLCQKERNSASRSFKSNFVPSCDLEGNFKDVQCYRYSNGTLVCWCADKRTGNEVQNTRRIDGKPVCIGSKVVGIKKISEHSKCRDSPFGCCADGKSSAAGPGNEGCPEYLKPKLPPHLQPPKCLTTKYGCCPGSNDVAQGPKREGCPKEKSLKSCMKSKFGCCPDGHTAAKGNRSHGCPKVRDGGPRKVRCYATMCGCCPDGVSIAMGPKYQGCGIEPPEVPKAKEICASLVLRQVWFKELENIYSPLYHEFAVAVKKAITKIYSVQNDFGRVTINGFQPGCYPYDPENVNSVIVYFTLYFLKAIDHALKPLQDHMNHYQTLAGRGVFTDSLMFTGIPSSPNGCHPLKPVSHPDHQASTPTAKPQLLSKPQQKPPTSLPPPLPSPSLPPSPSPHQPQTQQPPPTVPPLPPTTPPPSPPPDQISTTVSPPTVAVTTPPPQRVRNIPDWDFLALYFTFDDHKLPFVTDVSGHTNRGEMSVGVNVVGVEMGCGLAGSFSGGSIILDGNRFHPKPTQAVTIGFWVKFSNTVGEKVLFSTSASNSSIANYYLACSDGKITWCHKDERNKTLFETASDDIQIVAGQWAHVAVTYDSSLGEAAVFVNSEEVGKTKGSGILSQDWSGRAEIGSCNGNFHFHGVLDDFVMYTVALDPNTIKQLACTCSVNLGHYPSPEWGISEQCHRGPEPQPPTKATSNITTTQAPPDITSTSTPTTPPTALAPARPLSPPGPADGGYTQWSGWTECTSSCGGGMQHRFRNCTNPTPTASGKDCSHIGKDYETRSCNTQECPVDGGYTDWSTFSTCTKTCGGGTQVRTRSCTNPVPQFGGKTCDHLGKSSESRQCNTFFCPINGNYSEWSEWERCSETCGGGRQYRTRICTNPPAQYGGMNCDSEGPPREERFCNTNLCPVDGGYSPFGNWSACSATCGGGNMTRTRSCTNPFPAMGGKDCSQFGPAVEVMKCNEHKCPIDGGFTPFSEYSECSATCGGGVQSRMRTCTNPTPQFLGKDCEGALVETKMCNVQPCPVETGNGFSQWSECSTSCGGGIRSRSSTCGNDPSCQPKTETESCNTQPCPVPGGYSPWSDWAECSSSCGSGVQQRTRTCANPQPQHGGMGCEVLGPSLEVRNCTLKQCPVDGGFSDWTYWTQCSVSCGGGIRVRTRNCTSPAPLFGGKDCTELGPEQETLPCNPDRCPVSGGYSEWGDWSNCTASCGGGEQVRTRTCTNPVPEFGGNDCTLIGESSEKRECNTAPCPVPGGYTAWSNWTECSSTCGDGIQYRQRQCTNPAPQFGGEDCLAIGPATDQRSCFLTKCPESTNETEYTEWSECTKTCGMGIQSRTSKNGEQTQSRFCNTQECPVDGGYTAWSNWTDCSVSCGGGVSTRRRTCTNPEPQFDGKDCMSAIGPDTETKSCNMEKCPVPKVPIRSCQEYFRRCHANVDGIYTIYNVDGGETRAYCDMTKDGGGWTLLVTSKSKAGWDIKNVLLRNEEDPSLSNDYSILKYADGIKNIANGGFEYRLESSERGSNGGIWKAPQEYRFTNRDSSQIKINDVSKFGSWEYGKESLNRRMPWLCTNSDTSLLTTSEGKEGDKFGSIISRNKDPNSPSWIKSSDPSPTVIWYWMRESPGEIYEKNPAKKDIMCPKPVNGDYSEWSQWTQCTKSCGGGNQVRTRSCTSPVPIDGGLDCSDLGIGGDEERRQCNELVCPGQKVDGGYSEWSSWTECTTTCGGGSRMRNRTCNNPSPANDGKTCFDQQLGSETESAACNIQQCEGLCNPRCQNGGQCIGTQCQCTEMYEGKSCERAVCERPCLNGGTCSDPFKNICQCREGFCGDVCEKSGQTCSVFVFYFRVTNLVRKDVVFTSSDGIPPKGFTIKKRQIVEISKNVTSNGPVTFQVVNGNQLLFINKKQSITLVPSTTKGQPLSLTIQEPVSNKVYFTSLRVTNLARMNILLKSSDNVPSKGFYIPSNVIAEITKKTSSPQDLTFQAFDPKTSKVLFINSRQSFTVKPTEVKGPPVSMIIKAYAPPVKVFYIVLQVTNLAKSDIILLPSDKHPANGLKILNNVIAKIKKKTPTATPVTFTVIDARSREALYINDAKSISIVPKSTEDIAKPLIVTRTAKEVASEKYYVLIQVINKLPSRIVIIPDDNEPVQGFTIAPRTVAMITKVVHTKQAVTFTAIDGESDAQVLINGKVNVTLIPSLDKNKIESFTITSEFGNEETARPQIKPYYFWSFLTIFNGKILGHPTLIVNGHVTTVDDGLYFDGITGYLSTQLGTNNILTNPEKATGGFSLGIKLKFDSSAKEYDTPRYVLDTGAKSAGTAGMSLYVFNGQIVVELSSTRTKWKVAVDLVYDKWIYIIVNWKSSIGLELAVNGFLKASTPQGDAVHGLLPSNEVSNFCVGRNIAGSGAFFTKFYLASLVVFNQYLSSNLIYAVYSYYWVNVLVQPSKLYFVNLRIFNKYAGSISLKFSDNLPASGFLLKSNSIASIKKKTSNPTAITIHAEDPVTKKTFYVNDLPNFRVTPSHFEEQVTDLTVSAKSGIDGTALYQGVGCYNDGRNPRPLPELLKNFRGSTFDWSNYNNTIMKCALLAKEKNYKYFGLQFYGECWSGPNADSSYSKDGDSLECSNGVGKANANFVYKFIDQAIVPPSMFYLAVNIYNKYGGEIILKASDNQPSDQLIPVGGVAQLTKDIPNQQPVEFEAFDAKIPEKRLSIDNKKLVSITPSTVKGAPHNLEVQDGGESEGVESIKSPVGQSLTGGAVGILTTPWTISLRLANKDSRNIILFPSDNDPPQGFKVRRGYVVSLSKTLNSKQTVTFRAIEDESRAKVLLNGKESIQVTAARGKPTPLDVILTAFAGAAVSSEGDGDVTTVEAPPVRARHSWVFSNIVNNQVPGDISLSIHGQADVKEDAMIFDGSTTWLGATLASSDCLLAPSNCKYGLSIGFKIKLDPNLSRYSDERYVMDTGVLSKGTRGVSIFQQSGQLFCVVMTMSAQWKIGINVPFGKWIYVGMSWSELQGLYLFIDGRIVAQTKVSSPQNQVPISRISPNLVFGASLARTGFSKFYLATFTTFNTFLSQSAMRAVYTFYWRIGVSKSSKGIGFIHIKILNQVGRDIVVMSSDNVPARGFSLAKGFAVDFEKDVFDTGTVAFTAKDPVRGQVIYLNGKEKLEVNSSSFIDHGLNIIASTSRSQMFLGTTQYTFVLKLFNKVGSDMFLKTTDGVPAQGFAVKKGYVVVITKLSSSITPVGFSASDVHGNSLLLNGKTELILKPNITKGKPTEIVAIKAGVSSAVDGNKYYIGIKLLNKAGSDVILKSSDNNPKEGFKVKQGFVVLITKTVPSLQPVMFSAVDSKGAKIMLNNRVDIVMKPSPVKGNHFTVSMTPGEDSKSINTYFTDLKIINKNGRDIILKSSDNYPKNGYLIKQNTIAVITKKSPSNMPVDYTVVDAQSKNPVLVNHRNKITLRPRLLRSQPVNLLVGGTAAGLKKTQVEKPKSAGLTKSNVASQNALRIYYLVLKLVNRAGYDATIIPSDSQPPQFQVRKGYLEIVTKKSHSPRPVILKAVKSGTNETLSINGQENISLLPSLKKGEPITLNLKTKDNTVQETKLKPETKTPFYVSLHVSNKSPGETIFFPVKESLDSGFHLNPGTAMNIQETVENEKPLTYVALRSDDHKVLLMNNQTRLVITPAKTKTWNTQVDITTPTSIALNTSEIKTSAPQKDCLIVSCAVPKPPAVPDRYITLILHNKLGRMVRVLPSKGRHMDNGYLVKPHSFVKVSIIIKGEKYVEPITFRGEDLETQSKLLLNKALFPISLTPSDTPDAVTNISITAEAPHAKPLQSWSFSSYDGTMIPGSPSLSVHGAVTAVHDGLHFDGSTSSMDTSIEGYNCLHDPEKCPRGLSYGLKLRLDKEANDYTEPKFILDTGGHSEKTRGVALSVENRKLVAEVTTKNVRYRAATPLLLDQWIYVVVTFKKGLGLSLYYNAQLGNMDNTGTPIPDTEPLDKPKNLLIGRNIQGPPYHYAAFDMSSLTVFQEYLHEEDVNRVYLFFWSGLSAKIYYATLRIINGAGRAAVLKPDKGNADGFAVKPNSTQQIVLMSMSTDKRPIEPVTFHAIDAETSSKLMINHFIRPFVVVPKESRKEMTTILITAPAPSILPKYIWNFKHVDTGVVKDSSPVLLVHGVYEPEEESLRLLSSDSWIDAGDFTGTCISDPQMCDEGMAMAIKFKFNEEAKNYTDEPRFILDSGAHDPLSRGFSMYYKDGHLHCDVALSNAEWKVSAPITFHEWKYVMFTWKSDEGLSLYMNGHLKDQMKHSIYKPGLHHSDRFSRFEVARNTAGPPYGNAQFSINSLAFFDEYLSKADALREYIYYWGNAVPAFSNRYIKVRFDNKAGTNVRITPSKGGAKDQGYSIKPHMSLELSFVAKGTAANVPVTFRAQDELSGDALLINSSEEPFAVNPSDSTTQMTVATVTSSVKCLSPNGKFLDPTNEYGYIQCTEGSAKRVPCGIGLKWDDEKKSCERKGGLPTLYYATLQLHNNAGKDIQLIESNGKEPVHLLTKGDVRKIKLIGNAAKHYKFEAVDNSTEESLVLNNQPFTSLVLGEDPDKVMDITISNPSNYYTVTTYTGFQPDAGTNANVFVQLIGDQGTTEEIPLKHTGTKEFQPGQADSFRIPALDIGKIIKVKIKHDGSGKSSSWYLNKVVVKGDDQRTFEFPLYDWLTSPTAGGGHVVKELLMHHGKRTCIPTCKNGGECIGGKCQCPSPFEGASCEKAVCPIPCKNGGECVNPTTNECRCPQGYQGQYCENAICTSRCLNGGICIGPNRCTCLPAYSGLRCEISSCKPDCINGGMCKNGSCECSSGYSGDRCQIEHTCELSLETGPCLQELQREVEEGKATERNEGCSKYLTEILNNCQARSATYTQTECEKQCDPVSNNVCSRIWNPAKCETDEQRFRFNAQTQTCDEFMYSGCLGNNNNFVSEATCNQACGMDTLRRKRRGPPRDIISFLKRTI